MKPDQFAYINRYYGLSVKKGTRCVYTYRGERKEGTVTGTSSAHLMIRLDGAKHAMPHHPTENLEYLP